MAWTTPTTRATGFLVTASVWNTDVVDDLNLLKTSINDDGTLKLLLDRSTTEQDVSNTAVETSVYSFSVLGGTLSTANILHLLLTGYVDISVTTADLNIRVKFGGTTIASGQVTLTASAKGAVIVDTFINANGSTSSQRAVTRLALPGPASAPADGVYDGGTGAQAATTRYAAHSSLALDTTSAQTITVTAQWSTAQLNAHFKRFAAALRVLRT